MAERLNITGRNLGRKIGAPLLGLGILLSNPEQGANAFVDYSLPVLDQTWPDSEGGEVFAHMHFDKNVWGYYATEDNGLPQPYMIALNNALSNPVASAEIRKGQVKDLTVRKATSETGDNGQFDYRQSEVKLFISGKNLPSEDRLYFDTRVLKAVVIHEGFHADSEKWYQYMRGSLDQPRPSEDLAADIEQLQAAQRAVDDIYYSALPKPCSPNLGEAQSSCTQERLQKYADESFHCIDEGHALQDLLDREQPLHIGHPFNGTYEAAASVITSLEMNPSYMPDCLDKTPSNLTAAIRTLTNQILKLTFKTSPAIEEALRRTPDRNNAINRLIS